MNAVENATNEAGSPCDVPITPEYIEVPTANGRVKVRVDDLKRELYKDMVLNPFTISYGA
jgi:hypothetical protein